MNREPRFRRASTLQAYWNRHKLLFRNYASRKTVEANITAVAFLDFFSEWRTVKNAVEQFSGYTPETVVKSIYELVGHGLLLQEGTREAAEDYTIAHEWSPWLPQGGFHFDTKDAVYVQNAWSVEKKKATLPGTPPPSLFKSIEGTPQISLPIHRVRRCEFTSVLRRRRTHRQFADGNISLEAISQLLYLVWGVQGYLHSPIFGELPRKTSPSGGARHPIEVYLMALKIGGLSPGVYYYNPRLHCLQIVNDSANAKDAVALCAGQEFVGGAAALFLMTAVFARTMWKYHKPRAYRVVTLDAGHLCQTFCLVATWLGLAPFCTAALKDTMIERMLVIDGIRESVIYVAGLGLPLLFENASDPSDSTTAVRP